MVHNNITQTLERMKNTSNAERKEIINTLNVVIGNLSKLNDILEEMDSLNQTFVRESEKTRKLIKNSEEVIMDALYQRIFKDAYDEYKRVREHFCYCCLVSTLGKYRISLLLGKTSSCRFPFA